MKAQSWFADRVFWGVLAAGLALVGLWRWAVGNGATPAPEALVLLIVVYPLLEEIIFRGMIQPILHRWTDGLRCGPLSLANILTSVVFAIAHLPSHGILQSALVFGPSLVFGLFRDRHGTVASPAILHICWNAASVLLLTQGTPPF